MIGLLSRFQFKPVFTAAALIVFGILMTLGVWQLQRLSWKKDLVAKIEARVAASPIPFDAAFAREQAGENMAYTPVYIEGSFLHEKETHVFGTWDGQPGYYIFTPIETVDGIVYVNRGFAPQSFKNIEQREASRIISEQKIIGLYRMAERPRGAAAWVRPENSSDQNQWHVRDPKLFADQAGLKTVPAYIDSNGVDNPALWPKGGTTRVEFNNRHLEYALTWFGLALTLLGVWFFFSLRKPY